MVRATVSNTAVLRTGGHAHAKLNEAENTGQAVVLSLIIFHLIINQLVKAKTSIRIIMIGRASENSYFNANKTAVLRLSLIGCSTTGATHLVKNARACYPPGYKDCWSGTELV